MCTNEISKNLPPFLEKIKNGKYTPDDKDFVINHFLRDDCPKMNPEESEICQFLKGKSIFVTGGTGFLGKLLVEKLLRACIDIDSVYLLVRSKRGQDEKERLSQLVNDVVFERLANMHPQYKDKIKVIHGDMSLPSLAVSDSDRKLLAEKVNIIYHVAATTRFDEHLTAAVAINVNGTEEIIKLAKECKQLASLVYVSTAYSNCNIFHIDEKFYKPALQPEQIKAIVESMSREMISEVTPSILGSMPNSYTFTKQIAEKLVEKEAGNLPACVFRPSVVFSTLREPIKAWGDNILGPLGLILGIMLGVIRCIYQSKKLKMRVDIVPADYVTNACIACSYENTKNKNQNEIRVYNYTSGKENPIYWKDLYSDEILKEGRNIGTRKCIRYPTLIIVRNSFLFAILNILYHKTFGYVVDTVLRVMGKKPMLVKGYQKLDKLLKPLKYWSMNEFDFERDNVDQMWNSLSSQDKQMFPFATKDINWLLYILTLACGLKVYLLKESLEHLEKDRKFLRRMYYFYVGYSTIIYGVILFLSYKLLSLLFLLK